MNEINEKFKFRDVISVFKLLPRIFSLLWNTKKKYLVILIILSIINGLMPVITLKASQNLINKIQFSVGQGFEIILGAFLWLIIMSYFGDVMESIFTYYDNMFKTLLGYKLNEKIIKKANSLSLSNFEDSVIYDKITRAQNEASSRPYEMFSSINTLISTCVTLVSSLIVVFYWKSWTVLLLIIVPIISTYYFMYIGHFQFVINWKRASKQRTAWYLNFITTHDFAVKEIKIYDLGNYFLNKYKNITKEFYKQDKKLNKKRNLMSLFFSILTQLCCDTIVFLVLKSVYIGEIFIGDTVGLIRAISLAQSNSQRVIGTIFSMYDNTLYIKQLFEFFDMKEEILNEGNINIENIESVEFRNVTFAYQDIEKPILKNISFKINKYERVAIVGVNGSGKTTLVKLIARLYKPIDGEILVNGINVEHILQKSLMKNIGVVFQDFNKYEMSLRENIATGNIKNIDDDFAIMEACKKGQMDDLVNSLPKKLDSQLGLWFSEGTQLSGGQWQKVAISRAFFRNASLYILDEPSSFLDPKSELDLFNKFSVLSEEKISIFITHRFSNTNFANRILVLENGELIEDGTQEVLMDKKGVYYNMYTVQNMYNYL